MLLLAKGKFKWNLFLNHILKNVYFHAFSYSIVKIDHSQNI